MSKIKILTGWGHPGGSTFAHINLCNVLNEGGLDCTLYSPHQWHHGKCKSGSFNDIKLSEDDIIIYHFLNIWKERPPVKKLILSLHEKELYPLKEKPTEIFDAIHFLNEDQKDWHGYEGANHFFCPNAHEELKKFEGVKSRTAGIIGNIDPNKNVHTSIERALKDGHDKIRIFGTINDHNYYNQQIKPFMTGDDIVKYVGFAEKQNIYDLVTDVYHSSTSENASFIVDECTMTGVTLHGNDQTKEQPIIPNEDIFEIWKLVLGV